jgi:hypothetical protein
MDLRPRRAPARVQGEASSATTWLVGRPKGSPAVRRVQRSLAGVVLLVALVLPAGFAQAQATVFRFSDTHTDDITTSLEGCLPEDLVGTGTLTETSTGQVVDTGKAFTVRVSTNTTSIQSTRATRRKRRRR